MQTRPEENTCHKYLFATFGVVANVRSERQTKGNIHWASAYHNMSLILVPNWAKRHAKQWSTLLLQPWWMQVGDSAHLLPTYSLKGCLPFLAPGVVLFLSSADNDFMQPYMEPGQGTDFEFIFNLHVAFAAFCPLAFQTVLLPRWRRKGWDHNLLGRALAQNLLIWDKMRLYSDALGLCCRMLLCFDLK